MKSIGICGKIGSGKSSVTNLLKKENSYVLDCDKVAKNMIDNSPEILRNICDTFGEDLIKDGILDRKRLREIVFNSKSDLNKLNKITHSNLYEEVKNIINRLKSENKVEYIVVEAAVMFEAKLYNLLDSIIWVEAPLKLVLERVKKRDKNKEKTIMNIYKNQTDMDKYSEFIDYIIINDKDEKVLKEKVFDVLHDINSNK